MNLVAVAFFVSAANAHYISAANSMDSIVGSAEIALEFTYINEQLTLIPSLKMVLTDVPWDQDIVS